MAGRSATDRPTCTSAGHARPDALIFEGGRGPAPASLDALRRLFGALPRTVRWWSSTPATYPPIAQALLPFTGCALGTTEPIGDAGAIAFRGLLPGAGGGAAGHAGGGSGLRRAGVPPASRAPTTSASSTAAT
ncbi:MAG: hypothetical protein R3F60_24250 [bacterium]